jgi:hypothetical protein
VTYSIGALAASLIGYILPASLYIKSYHNQLRNVISLARHYFYTSDITNTDRTQNSSSHSYTHEKFADGTSNDKGDRSMQHIVRKGGPFICPIFMIIFGVFSLVIGVATILYNVSTGEN